MITTLPKGSEIIPHMQLVDKDYFTIQFKILIDEFEASLLKLHRDVRDLSAMTQKFPILRKLHFDHPRECGGLDFASKFDVIYKAHLSECQPLQERFYGFIEPENIDFEEKKKLEKLIKSAPERYARRLFSSSELAKCNESIEDTIQNGRRVWVWRGYYTYRTDRDRDVDAQAVPITTSEWRDKGSGEVLAEEELIKLELLYKQRGGIVKGIYSECFGALLRRIARYNSRSISRKEVPEEFKKNCFEFVTANSHLLRKLDPFSVLFYSLMYEPAQLCRDLEEERGIAPEIPYSWALVDPNYDSSVIIQELKLARETVDPEDRLSHFSDLSFRVHCDLENLRIISLSNQEKYLRTLK